MSSIADQLNESAELAAVDIHFDVVGNEKVTLTRRAARCTLDAARAAAGAGLLLPGNGRRRGAASLFLGLSNVAHPAVAGPLSVVKRAPYSMRPWSANREARRRA
ncbi:hypothetical protein DVA86_08970 [Streptomyces armeniacus]|uniref:Uncharacterized protein n=2 Tax=Streptomyces armeniacus TaxID=83291 RepID=A0A345XM91_9ACTN|nr:hypothetical protein DVA86_08970 [Streptomyces armeniacus]